MKTKQLTGRVQVKDATTGEVEVVFATLGVKDLDGDIILPGAIEEGASIDISGYGHAVWKGDRPVGVGSIHEVGDELVMKGRYFMDVDEARNDFHTVKGLAEAGKGEWSFGLINTVSTKGTHNGQTGNLISSVEVPEVSPVWKGAGINTRTLVAKNAGNGEDAPTEGLKFSEHLASVLADVKALTDRAEEVVALRAAKGKTISEEASETLAGIGVELERIKALTEAEPPNESGDVALVIDGEVFVITDTSQGDPQ